MALRKGPFRPDDDVFGGVRYYELEVHLPRCETIAEPGWGGRVSAEKYVVRPAPHASPHVTDL